MACAHFLRLALRGFFHAMVLVLATVVLTSNGAAQAASATAPPFSPEDLKNSALLKEFGQLVQKFQAGVHYPEPRGQSHLLPLLLPSTMLYVAIPNYGEATHQALVIFEEERKESPELRDWWGRTDLAKEGPKIEENLDRFYQLSQYLGDEIVVAGATDGRKDPHFVFLAEVIKPGLKDFLKQTLKDIAGKSEPEARVFDLADFATAQNVPSGKPVILVRPDLVVLGENLETLRKFNAHLDRKEQGFATTEFGKRMAQGYEGGSTLVAGADMQAVLAHLPLSSDANTMLERTGFGEMKYLVWEHKQAAGQAASQLELSFTGPRHAVASWLASPGPMDSLDFVSPKAVIASAMLLKNPAQIFDDVRDLATAQNPNAFASVMQMEDAMKISLRNDFFGRLGGEIAFELDRAMPIPEWKVIFKSSDPSGLLATLRVFMKQAKMTPVETDEDGIAYHTIQVPLGARMQDISYAVVDGYLIVASSREAVAESARLHREGNSLGKSEKFQAALPPSPGGQMSAVFYEDPLEVAALTMRQVSPELADAFSKPGMKRPVAAVAAYGDPAALREASRSSGMDFGGMLVVGAIAIPNLIRARMAANESSAVASLRTVNTAQVIYAASYPPKGFARDLASLGPDPKGTNTSSRQHAGVIEASLANSTCIAGAWCVKSGYRFSLSATCRQQRCSEYVVVATPLNNNTGTRSFCSTSDTVIRYRAGVPLSVPITAAQCKTWAPLH